MFRIPHLLGVAAALAAASCAGGLARYPQTPFTLALIDEAERPEGGFAPDMSNASDVAYCTYLYERASRSASPTSDFAKNNRDRAKQMKERLLELTGSAADADALIARSESTYSKAISMGRSGNNAALMAFNFGGHAAACREASATL